MKRSQNLYVFGRVFLALGFQPWGPMIADFRAGIFVTLWFTGLEHASPGIQDAAYRLTGWLTSATSSLTAFWTSV